MRFVDDIGLGVGLPDGFQQTEIGSEARRAIRQQGGIGFHLTGHQDDPAGSRRPSPAARADIVFGEPLGRDARTQSGRTLADRRVELLRRQHMFEIGYLRRIVVRSPPIDDPGHGADQINAQAHRAQKTVFHAQQADGAAHILVVSAPSPDQRRLAFRHIRHTAHEKQPYLREALPYHRPFPT